MDVSQYLEIFIDETREHLQNLNEQLLVLEKEPENSDTINEIFRAAHSLKGMAGTMGYKRMQRLTHDMENVFSEIRNGKMKAGAALVDVLFRGLDALENYLDNIINTQDEGTEDNQDIIDGLQKLLEEGLGGESDGEKEKQPEAPAPAAASAKERKHLVLAEHELHAANKAKSDGENVFEIAVYIQESCLLKAARAFLVFKALEDAGDIIKSVPEVQDIEDEKFDFEFSLVLLTKKTRPEIEQMILNVSEIKEVLVEDADLSAPSVEVTHTAQEQVTEAPANNNKESSETEAASSAGAAATAVAPAPKEAAAQTVAASPAKDRKSVV